MKNQPIWIIIIVEWNCIHSKRTLARHQAILCGENVNEMLPSCKTSTSLRKQRFTTFGMLNKRYNHFSSSSLVWRRSCAKTSPVFFFYDFASKVRYKHRKNGEEKKFWRIFFGSMSGIHMKLILCLWGGDCTIPMKMPK